jgi:hypothetical protein
MTDLRNAGSAGGFSCFCSACGPSSAISRRQFLCTGTAGAVAASVVGATATSSGTAHAQQPASAPGRPILIKGGCVLTLDRALGDFEAADVLIEGKTISAVRPNITAPNDFFSQMRTVFSLQKREVWERRHAGDKNPPAFLTVREVLEFATIQGARANGLDRKIGTLTPGKEADIILLRTDRLNVMPMNNAVGAVVSNMGPQNVDTVLIAGKVMKRNGQMLGLDFARLERLGDEARDRVYAAAKVKNSRV